MSFWKRLILICLWLTPVTLAAFNTSDSLIQALPTLKSNEKVDALNDISWALKFSENKAAGQYANDALQLAQNIKYRKGEGQAIYNLSVIHSIKGDFERSSQYAKACISIHQELDNAKLIAKGWNVLGVNSINQSKYDTALVFLGKALDISEALGDTAAILSIRGNIGNVHFNQGDYEQALNAYHKLIEFGKVIRDTVMWSTNLGNAGSANSLMGRHPLALKQLYEAYDLYQATNNKALMARTLSDIGLLLKRIQLLEEAEGVFKESLALNEQLGNKRQLGMVCNNLGIVYYRLKRYDLAINYYEKTIAYYESVKVKAIGNALGNIAKVYTDKGQLDTALVILYRALENDSLLNKRPGMALRNVDIGAIYLKKNQLDRAEYHLLKGYQLWAETDQVKDLSSAAGFLSNLYEAKGDMQKALIYRTEYKETQDSVYGIENQKEIIRILLERQQQELKTDSQSTIVASKDTDHSGYLIPGAVLLFALGSIVFVYRKRQHRHLQEQLNAQNQNLQDLQSSLEKKNLEVAFLSLSTIQKDEFIRQFTQKLNEFSRKHPQNWDIQKLLNSLHLQDVNTKDWDYFKQAFEQISPHFFDQLFERYPKLSNKELRHCALIRLNIPIKDVAQILGISVSGVHKARYRLRKQFGLDRGESLENHLNS